jgi:hypothetical protein
VSVPRYRWTQDDFDAMCWHDNAVHALRIEPGDYGAGRLLLDVDYILEWLCGEDGACRFRILPATLAFLEVSELRIALDYATPTAALGPFSIAAIERTEEARAGYSVQRWRIVINWPAGEISFCASGFEQLGRGAPLLRDGQSLAPAERAGGF